MNQIDLRSDTVTLPPQEMRDAMYRAEVGDDVYGEDPTVNRLQEAAAEIAGKEAALFVPSGTMGNLLALLTHCGRGDEVIVGERSHIMLHEQGSVSALASVFPKALRNQDDGTISTADLEAAITVDDGDDHIAHTKLICLENTWNGRVLRPDYVGQVAGIAGQFGLPMHLDGARIFNASRALNRPVQELVREFASVQFCFSKGLSAPVGSILCGSSDFVRRARRLRKMLGGGMRQAGIIAAGCLYAVENMVARLVEDHENATMLAQGLSSLPGIRIDMASVETNMVVFSLDGEKSISTSGLCEEFAKEGVLVMPLDQHHIRAVTHYGVSSKDIDTVLSRAKVILNRMPVGV